MGAYCNDLMPKRLKLQAWTHQNRRPPSNPHHQGGDIPAEMAPLCVNVGDTYQVYCCQVAGCPEGLSSSHTTICTHVCHAHLGSKVLCPLCHITFFNTMPSNGMASGHIPLDLWTQLKECYTGIKIKIELCQSELIYKKEIMLLKGIMSLTS